MRTQAAVGTSLVLLLIALAVAGAAVGRPQASTIRVSALLTAAQEVPAPKGDVGVARGTFAATVTRSGTGDIMTWQLTFTGLTGPAGAAHVHLGASGTAGGVVVPLCESLPVPGEWNCERHSSGSGCFADGRRIRERPYADECARRDSGPDRRGRERDDGAQCSPGSPEAEGQRQPRTRDVHRDHQPVGGRERIGWRLAFSGLTGRADAAHIHIGARGKAGASRCCALRAVSQWHAEERNAVPGCCERPRSRSRVRQHPHRSQPCRRGTWADRTCRAPDHGVS